MHGEGTCRAGWGVSCVTPAVICEGVVSEGRQRGPSGAVTWTSELSAIVRLLQVAQLGVAAGMPADYMLNLPNMDKEGS